MKKILIFSFIILSVITHAQNKQDYVWLLGQSYKFSANFSGSEFNFNDPPMEVKERRLEYGIGKANASICDKNGNFLFYTNGCAVINREFDMMENGDSLGYDIFWETFNKNCLRGIGSFQDHMILNDPGDQDEYYILHKPSLFNGNTERDSFPIWYSKVDISENDGLGSVTEKNIILDKSVDFLVSYLTAIQHANGNDWWIIQGSIEDSLFHTYLLDKDGIELSHIQNSHWYFTYNRSAASGTAKFSPDGTKYAFYNYYDQLHVYDFDRETGMLSNHNFYEVIPNVDYYDLRFSSIEWSPNGRFIYTASKFELHQVDLWEDNIQENGIRLIDVYNGTQDPFTTNFFLMAQAPDCKIYMCPTNGSYSFHVIHHPDELGTACKFEQNGLKLPYPSNGGGFPNFPRFRVDEEDKCDPTLTSVFGDQVYYRRDLKVYPSPSDGRYTVDVPDEFKAGTLTVHDLDGQIIRQIDITPGTLNVSVDITAFPSGYYHIELYPEDNPERVFWGTQVVKN